MQHMIMRDCALDANMFTASVYDGIEYPYLDSAIKVPPHMGQPHCYNSCVYCSYCLCIE